MAPSRRKGSSKAAAAAADRRQWKVGDLVLAKVKGFPAWPAMVSEPDKWGYSADWKKVFVYFFGTEQIGFCNPVDVEEFTEEKKESLLVRRHGKGSDFVRALNEIIDCFDKLKKQSQGISANSIDETKAIKENNAAESVTNSGSKEEAPAVALKSHLKTPISSGATHDLNFLTEAAVAAAAEDGLHDLNMRLEDSDANCTATEKPSLTTYSTRSKAEVSQPEKGVSERRTSARRSRGSSRIRPIGPQDMALPSSNNTRSSRRVVINALRDTSLRRSKRIMKLPDDIDGHEIDSPAFLSNDSNDENDSETVTVSDNRSCDDSSTLDSGCKPNQPESVVENCEGEIELSDRLDFQTNTVINKKKRKPNRKRLSNDTTDLVARLDRVISEAEVQKIEHVLPSNDGKSPEKCTKEDGDEHLPLVKRARVRMGRPSPSGEEPGSVVCMEEKLLDVSQGLAMQSSGPLNSKEDGSADRKPVLFEGDSDNPSVFDTSLSRKPQSWESRKNFVDGEAALPPSKRLHRALEAMSANAAEDSLTVSEGLSKVNTSTNGYCCSSPGDYPELSMVSRAEIQPGAGTAEGANGRRLKDSYDQIAEFNIVEPKLKPDSSNSGDKQARLDCTSSSTDHCETECSELAKPFKGSHADITRRSSDPILVEEITVGSPQNTDIYLDKGCSKGDKTLEMQDLLSAETNQENRMPEFVKEDESVSNDPSATPMKVVTDEQLSHSNSSFDDHLEDKTASFTQTSSSPTDGLDSVGRASPPNLSIRNMSTSEKNNFLESNSRSPDVLLLLDKAKLAGKSSSKGESNNALSSFETILGSLTRTKESIGRATRIAIDCAKFGFATKVVEILARNLESESSLSRRVDLFFLIDSITQCSRGMKGDGGIYPSAIQPLLPRLLLAAAPPGSSHENHRQCLKVLRVWHERKILPEPIIRHHIQELDAICSSYLTGASSRRPLRNERAFDDPIRQMEGMPVDEYGSNSSFQLPGFCMPPMLRDEDGGSDSDGENFEAVTPEHNAENVDGERNPVPAVEKRRHILEDVDGELEMEDVAPACEAEINYISNINVAGSEQMSNHQSDNRFGAPFAPPPPKDIPPSPPLPRSPRPPALPPAMPDSVSHGSDWKLYQSLQKNKSNIQEPPAKPSIMPNINPATSDDVHHHAHDNRNFEAQMPRMSDFTNSHSFSGQPGSHPSMRASNTISPADGAFNKGFHLRPPHPSPTNQFSYVQDQRMQSRRDVPAPSYHNRFHEQNAGNGYFHRDHEIMKFAQRDNIGECWRPPLPSISGPSYPEGGRMPRAPMSYTGPPCEPPLPNNRWACPPQHMNDRQFIPYRQPSEGPIPVANRGPNFWRPRRAI
ncbi:HUA2-like protein 2 [Forsythia ovata]|uniref:HUA2-like protein 2 n=1 Tax=Forsythia ovata TaxID=205694 RepID=A0ABD1T4V1_9LAMI